MYADGWIFIEKDDPYYKRMKSYHQYFGFCAKQVFEADRLADLRKSFAKDFLKYMPLVLTKNHRSIVYKMDAKIAEYCLLGLAAKEGLING